MLPAPIEQRLKHGLIRYVGPLHRMRATERAKAASERFTGLSSARKGSKIVRLCFIRNMLSEFCTTCGRRGLIADLGVRALLTNQGLTDIPGFCQILPKPAVHQVGS